MEVGCPIGMRLWIGINEAMYFTMYLYGGLRPPYNYVIKYIASFIPIDSSKASSQWGNQPPSLGMIIPMVIPMALLLGMIASCHWDDHPNHPNCITCLDENELLFSFNSCTATACGEKKRENEIGNGCIFNEI